MKDNFCKVNIKLLLFDMTFNVISIFYLTKRIINYYKIKEILQKELLLYASCN